MEPHTSSYLSKYIVKLFRLYRRRRADYIYTTACATNKVYCGTKRCLILDVRISSLEVDLRVPGNHDDFPFSQAEWSLPSYFPRFVRFPSKSSLVREKPIVTVSHVLLENKTIVINGFKVLFPKLATVHIFFFQWNVIIVK